MARHPPPSDTFTRFTSTPPHAASQSSPPPSSTSSAFNVASPDGETPAQKVARLRAAARAQKEAAMMSTTDRVIAGGRVWADRAHRFVAYSLIGFTGIAAAISIYSLTSLVLHNRRQKRAWIERELDRLKEAQQAFLRGEASAEQLHLLEQERAGEEIQTKFEADKRRRKEEGIWGRVKGVFRKEMQEGQMGRETGTAQLAGQGARSSVLEEGWVQGEVSLQSQPPPQRRPGDEFVPEGLVPAAVQESGIRGVGIDEKGRPVPVGKMVRTTGSPNRWQNQREMEEKQVAGGPLDVMADHAATRVNDSVSGDQGWLSWIRGGKS